MGFSNAFVTTSSISFESIICSAHEAREVAVLYYQNDIELMHLVKKKKHRFRKENMMEAIKNVRKSEIEQIKKKSGINQSSVQDRLF